MRSYPSLLTFQLFALALIFAHSTLAFSSSSPSLLREACSSRSRLESCRDNNEEVQPKAEYGVSYIGGDPCGSKYNNDPFDVQVQKPGMPDDMKARIQALVDKKVAEEKAAAEADAKSDSS